MTLSQAKEVYCRGTGRNEDDHSPFDWQQIWTEMRDVIAAKSDRAAGRIIAWWECWPSMNGHRNPTQTARAIRLAWKELNP